MRRDTSREDCGSGSGDASTVAAGGVAM